MYYPINDVILKAKIKNGVQEKGAGENFWLKYISFACVLFLEFKINGESFTCILLSKDGERFRIEEGSFHLHKHYALKPSFTKDQKNKIIEELLIIMKKENHI